MKTEHDFFEEFIDYAVSESDIEKINKLYNLLYEYINEKEREALFKNYFLCDLPFWKCGTYQLLKFLKILIREKIIERLTVAVLSDDRFTPQEVRDKIWEFKQEYKDKKLDPAEIGGDLDEYAQKIVNELYLGLRNYE